MEPAAYANRISGHFNVSPIAGRVLDGSARQRRSGVQRQVDKQPTGPQGTDLLQSTYVLRKEVIQPQVPLRLPCYDFTPVADLTVAGCLLKG